MDSDASLRTLSAVHYYLREGYFGTALKLCETRGQESADHQVAVLKGVALLLIGKSAEALRCFDSLKEGECSLGALYGLKAAHSAVTNPDRQSLSEIDSSITSFTKTASDLAQLSAAEVLYFTGQHQKARTLIEKAVKYQENIEASGKNVKLLCLMGWIDLALGKAQRTTRDMFEIAASQNYPDGFVGRSRICEEHQASGDMKVVTKEFVSAYPSFLPSHLERIRSCLVDRDWDAVLPAIQNSSLATESDNALISFLNVLHAVCAGGSKVDTALQELKTCLTDAENDNHQLLYRIAAVLIRCGARNRTVMMFAKSLLVRALQLSRKDEYTVEELRLAIALEDPKETISIAKDLIQAGCEHPFAVLGMSIGYLMNGKVKDAAEQYEFVQTTYPNISSTSIFHFVGALIARHKEKSFENFKKKLNDALEVHRAALQNRAFGIEFLTLLDVDLLFSIASQLLDYAPLAPVKVPDATLKMAQSTLELIIDYCPGISQVTFQLARLYYLESENEKAEQIINLCLKKNETVAEAYLLRAQMRVDKNQEAEADACLTTGLNFNFAVRDSSLYHLIKAKVLKRRKEVEKAVDLLRAGLKLPQKEQSNNLLARKETVDAHRISIQIELIDCLQTMKRRHDAESTMEAALQEWKGKPEEEQLLLLNAQLLVAKGDADGALAILNKVQPTQPNYQSARVKMAEIYLEEKKDKRMFTACYRELMTTAQTPATLTMLGDAYLSIQEPEKAIEVFEKGLKMSSTRDIALTEKIGEAYVLCHLYTKAVNFYESAMNASKDRQMRLKLANLLLKLGNVEKCERILKQPLTEEPSPTEPATISANVQYLRLLAKLHLENEKWAEAVEDLNNAKQLQLKLVQKNSSDSPSNLQAKKEAARINCSLAELRIGRREMKEALDLFNEALALDPANVKIILSIASVHMTTNRLTKCSESCKQALLIDKNNDEATLLMADLLYLQNDMEQAIVHFVNLLEKYPNHYHALARCIELAWRRGHVEQAEKQLKRAIEHNPRAAADSGYNYCKALHEWYSGEPNAALQAFNRARKDVEWGEKSICNMIEICLNPDNEVLGGERMEQGEGDDADRQVGTKTAERFLNELRLKGHGTDGRYALMSNFIMVASGDKGLVQQALQTLLNMAGAEGQPVVSVGAVLGVARAYLLQKNGPKAKAMLKRVVGHPWTLEDADYLEKCWLLLADTYINQNKGEQATTVLRTVMQRNLSCIKAYELMGLLREKEGHFVDAAAFYEDAWRLSRRKNPVLGYKLAYNYLKCRRLFDCLEVCQMVLKQFPTYPRIKREIMDKARMQLRS